MELGNDEDLKLGLNDVTMGVDNENMESKEDETPNKKKRQTWRLTIMFDVTKIRSVGDKKMVEYNDDWVPIVCITISQLHMHLESA